LLTDPPYGVNIVKTSVKVGGDKPFGSTKGKVGGNHIVESNQYMPIIGDEGIETAQKSFEVAKQFSKIQVVFGGNYFTDFLPASRCWYVWDKGMAEGSFFSQCELAWVSKDGNAKLFKRLWAGLCREGDRKTEGTKRIHPTQKPVSLCCDIIKQFDCESVLDLFGGSGSTLIACEQMEKTCYMMELSPNYVDVIINRWETFTGKKAVKLNAD
jgi:DNA modification methylase